MRDPQDPGTLELDFSVSDSLATPAGNPSGVQSEILDPLPAEIPEESQEEDSLPLCVLAMGCFCAGHARGNPNSAPCDTSEVSQEETPEEPVAETIAIPAASQAVSVALQGTRSTLRPGLLVSLRTKIHGGVDYDKRMLPPPDLAAQETASVKRWETTRTIADPEEWDKAVKVRSDARGLIVRACCYSDFGLLCPDNKEEELDAAIVQAREMIAEHNKGARRSQISLYVIAGRVAQDDVEATRAIGAEIRETVEAMRVAIAKADPEAIRTEATRARQLAGMLSDAAKGRVDEAVSQARKAARELAKRVSKGGEDAATVLQGIAVDALKAEHFAFLDTSDLETVQPEAIAAPAVDLGEAQ